LRSRTAAEAWLSELLRLRGEVGRLRQQVDELNRLQAQDRRIQTGASAKRESDATSSNVEELNISLPKGSWTFAGYGTPEAALQTMMWARREGDTKSLLASLAPEFVEKANKAWGDMFEEELKSALPGKIPRVSDCTIWKKEAISDTEFRLWYRVVEQDELRNVATAVNITAKRVGEDWKLMP
jgi:hypothetical protein